MPKDLNFQRWQYSNLASKDHSRIWDRYASIDRVSSLTSADRLGSDRMESSKVLTIVKFTFVLPISMLMLLGSLSRYGVHHHELNTYTVYGVWCSGGCCPLVTFPRKWLPCGDPGRVLLTYSGHTTRGAGFHVEWALCAWHCHSHVSLSQQNSIGPGDEWHDCICDENPTSESLLAISIS